MMLAIEKLGEIGKARRLRDLVHGGWSGLEEYDCKILVKILDEWIEILEEERNEK
jgi:hypothetical protein